MAEQTLTDYERRRLENIKRNEQMVASLKLQSMALDLSSAHKRPRVEIKGYRPTLTKKSRDQGPIVIRRSLRARGIPPDSASAARDLEGDFVSSPEKPNTPWKKTGPFNTAVAFIGGSAGNSDKELVDTIAGLSENIPLSLLGGRHDRTSGGKVNGVVSFNLGSLKLDPRNIARVVPGRVLNVSFLPSSERRVIVSGDKLGHVCFWDVDYAQGKGDGVYLYCPHSAPVSGISVQPFSLSKIYTSSYDGFIRLMDIVEETFKMVYFSDDPIFALSQRQHDMKSLYFGEGDGELKAWDGRAGKISSSCILHSQRINSIDFNPENTNLMATSSTDGTACIWDLRSINMGQPKSLKTVKHQRAVHSAFFSPSGSCLATTSPDNRVGLLSGVDFTEMAMISHNNQTSRWISSFRAIWGWDDSHLFLGNTKRAVDIISTASKSTTTLYSPYMTAIPCRFSAHPYMPGTLAGATGGGQVYMWTTTTEDES